MSFDCDSKVEFGTFVLFRVIRVLRGSFFRRIRTIHEIHETHESHEGTDSGYSLTPLKRIGTHQLVERALMAADETFDDGRA